MTCQPAVSEQSGFPALRDGPPEPVSREAVPRFLEPYGYGANTALEWGAAAIPELSLQVHGHKKVGGYVYYDIECELAELGQWQSPLRKWTATRRLGQLREGLHNPVKNELGSEYRTKFQGTHFAHKVAVRGTTSRLDGWCRKLAGCLNNKELPPVVASIALQLLMPDNSEHGAPDEAEPTSKLAWPRTVESDLATERRDSLSATCLEAVSEEAMAYGSTWLAMQHVLTDLGSSYGVAQVEETAGEENKELPPSPEEIPKEDEERLQDAKDEVVLEIAKELEVAVESQIRAEVETLA